MIRVETALPFRPPLLLPDNLFGHLVATAVPGRRVPGCPDPAGFVATDLGVRAAARVLRIPDDASALTARAQAWRPWRAYAVQHLWAVLDHPVNVMPG